MSFLDLVIAFVAVAGTTAGLIFLGYWMGRNSSDRPVRSPYNPSKTDQGQAAIDEPSYDVFNEAAFGEPGSQQRDQPTTRGH